MRRYQVMLSSPWIAANMRYIKLFLGTQLRLIINLVTYTRIIYIAQFYNIFWDVYCLPLTHCNHFVSKMGAIFGIVFKINVKMISDDANTSYILDTRIITTKTFSILPHLCEYLSLNCLKLVQWFG